ncbi:hypothetical protein IFM47457_04052 [Aspergillus lentulus]|nr:hypothetical protein IFM47457_04052 [Aspergillus lentulus]
MGEISRERKLWSLKGARRWYRSKVSSLDSLMTLGHGIENERAQVQKGQTHSVVQPAGEPKKGPSGCDFLPAF